MINSNNIERKAGQLWEIAGSQDLYCENGSLYLIIGVDSHSSSGWYYVMYKGKFETWSDQPINKDRLIG